MGQIATHFDNWCQITRDPWVLQCVQGYRLEFETAPHQASWPTAPNFTAAQALAIDHAVSKLLEKGAVTQTLHTQGEFLSNIFLVPKKTGDLRPVFDLKHLNRHVCKKKFKMETMGFAVQLINEGDYMASIDLKDAYFSIPKHVNDRKYLRFMWHNQLLEFVCMPFGYSLAPRSFTKVLKPAYSHLRMKSVKVSYYIDDTLLVAPSQSECTQSVRKVINLLEFLGFTINHEKSSLQSTREISYLDFNIDSHNMTVSF